MKSEEDIVREFVTKKPSPGDENVEFHQKMYDRDRALLGVLLDVRRLAEETNKVPLTQEQVASARAATKKEYEEKLQSLQSEFDIDMGEFE